MSYTRFAIYYLPPEGDLAAFGAAWLGWDVETGKPARHFDVAGLDDVTATPRKYGLHATLKPPFRLKAPACVADLTQAVEDMVADTAPATCKGLRLSQIGSFLALVPAGASQGLARVAARCVADLDPFRAEPSEEDLARRRLAGLSVRQDALLVRWGYPYVMEEFGFHITLTGRLAPETGARWHDTVEEYLPTLPAPFVMDQIALAGERPDGRFELIQRYTLAG